jgi:hypothetical protein
VSGEVEVQPAIRRRKSAGCAWDDGREGHDVQEDNDDPCRQHDLAQSDRERQFQRVECASLSK